ncbi:hypothetical protein BDN70DRAFT_895361 [Pholiota conissans]|uniref:Uncharacterized protein n=1 Tax=Pholiota conissans TaxID=109636 RepID=A0A9P6CTW6_9AGAR|nr:hypothetical protein BDN70DRAFT_895361 [Pholiota conissans]
MTAVENERTEMGMKTATEMSRSQRNGNDNDNGGDVYGRGNKKREHKYCSLYTRGAQCFKPFIKACDPFSPIYEAIQLNGRRRRQRSTASTVESRVGSMALNGGGGDPERTGVAMHEINSACQQRTDSNTFGARAIIRAEWKFRNASQDPLRQSAAVARCDPWSIRSTLWILYSVSPEFLQFRLMTDLIGNLSQRNMSGGFSGLQSAVNEKRELRGACIEI